jgi:hypothetical protein
MPIQVLLLVVSKGFRELTGLGQVSLGPEKLISAEVEGCVIFSCCESFRFCFPDYLVPYRMTLFFFRLMGGKC